MKKPFLLLMLLPLVCVFALSADGQQNKRPAKMKLVWSDEFKKDGLPDKTKWSYDVGDHGWGNQEKQYYTRDRLENARVKNGKLIIEARREDFEKAKYTSARLVTKGKGDWKFGRIEVRAKIPKGLGTWAAIWMLPSQTIYGKQFWVDNGEIDIMENVGFEPNVIHASTHTLAYNWMKKEQKTAIHKVPTADSKFHVYWLDWTPERVEIYVDKTKYFTHENEGKGWETYPFDQKFHLILNIAVGGSWGGQKGIDDKVFPAQMEIDWVRVYQAQ